MEFSFAGHNVRLILRNLPGDHKQALNNWVGVGSTLNGNRSQPGLAQAYTIQAGVKRLEIDGEEIAMTNRKKPLPLILDNERRITFFDYVLGCVVQRNQWLLWDEDYRPVFQPYLDMLKDAENEDEDDEGEPVIALSMRNPT